MKLISMLLLLAGVLMMMLGIKYDERAGERRDQLPIGWFGGILFRGVQAYPIGTSYENRSAAPENSAVPQITANQNDIDAYFKTGGENIYSVPGSINTCPVNSFTDFKNIIEDKLSDIKEGVQHDIEVIEATAGKTFNEVRGFSEYLLSYLVPAVTLGIYSVDDLEKIVAAHVCGCNSPNDHVSDAVLDGAADFAVGSAIKPYFGIHNSFASLYYWLHTLDRDNVVYFGFISAGVTLMTFPRFMSGLFLGAIAWGMPEIVSEWLSALLMHMLADELAIGLISLFKSAVAGGIGREVFNYFMRVSGMTIILVAFVGMAIGMLNKY